MQPDRLTQIQQHLYAHGRCSIQDLALLTGASLATVRRDLQRLEDGGLVVRNHGGAALAEAAAPEAAFQAREQQDLDAKRAIAELAFGRLRPHTAVLLDAGTTVLQLARRLRLSPLPITVFTNGLPLAQELLHLPGVRVTLLGGQVRDENLSLVGPYAERLLQEFSFDQLFLGTSALGADGQLYTQDAAEAALNRRMLERSAQTYLLADAGKFGRTATYCVGPVQAVTELISDDRLNASWRQRLRDLQVNVTLAPTGRTA